jgi:hypothetical protein
MRAPVPLIRFFGGVGFSAAFADAVPFLRMFPT